MRGKEPLKICRNKGQVLSDDGGTSSPVVRQGRITGTSVARFARATRRHNVRRKIPQTTACVSGNWGGEGEESFRLTAAEWRFGHGVPASIGPMCIQRQMFLLGVKVPIWPWPVAAGGKGESGGRTRKTKYKYSHCSPSIASQMEATRFLFIWFVPVGDRWGRASKRNVP